MADESEFTVVAAAVDGISGSILAGVLESAGIPAEVRGGRSSWLFPNAGGGLGAVDVLVPGKFVTEARAILAGHLDGVPEGQEPVVLAVVDGSAASFMAGALQSAGIPAMMRGGRGGLGVSVFVPRELRDDANAILTSLEDEPAGETPGGDEDDASELCGADENALALGDEDGGPGRETADVSASGAGDGPGPEQEDILSDSGDESGPGAEALDPPENDVPATPEAEELEPAGGGPPEYGSDLRPDYGGYFEPGGGAGS